MLSIMVIYFLDNLIGLELHSPQICICFCSLVVEKHIFKEAGLEIMLEIMAVGITGRCLPQTGAKRGLCKDEPLVNWAETKEQDNC